MARPIEELEPDGESAAPSGRRLRRSAARAFAGALSTLAVAALVITGSSDALEPDRSAAASSAGAGAIELMEGEAGRSLVQLRELASRGTTEQCVEVVHVGAAVPVRVVVAADVDGGLAPFVLVTVERGTGSTPGDCSAFVATAEVYGGTLGALEAAGGTELGLLGHEGAATSFRFRFELADDAPAVGPAGTALFEWEARGVETR